MENGKLHMYFCNISCQESKMIIGIGSVKSMRSDLTFNVFQGI